jgi:putative heme iron utilization protein
MRPLRAAAGGLYPLGPMNNKAKSDAALAQEIVGFRDSFRSMVMATVNKAAEPESSYAPFVVNEQNEVFVFVSGLARHTRNLNERGQASLMFIEDESQAANVFARRRLVYQCKGEPVMRDSDEWSQAMALFDGRFGRFMETLRALPDFQLFRLVPVKGSYVTGFGKAYQLEGDALAQIRHLGPDELKKD